MRQQHLAQVAQITLDTTSAIKSGHVNPDQFLNPTPDTGPKLWAQSSHPYRAVVIDLICINVGPIILHQLCNYALHLRGSSI